MASARAETHLTRTAQYDIVYKKGSSWAHPLLAMRALSNGLGVTRYGITVSRRVGKAVVRNRIKRLLREILRKTSLKPGWDIIFVARPPAAGRSYVEIEAAAKALLSRAGMLSSGHEKNCPGTN